jgi:AcrR family transcriptional regulator
MTGKTDKPKKTAGVRRRRKEARPGEIVEVALDCFLENGFEATKLDEVARRAGIAKGTIYIYFETKEQLFRAVVQHVASANVQQMTELSGFDMPLEDLVPMLTGRFVETIGKSRAPAIARLILREVDRFPDLAQVWFETVAGPMLGAVETALSRAQARGEIRAGDARLQVFSIMGPIIVGLLFTEVLGKLDVPGLDLDRLARQHSDAILHGLLKNHADGTPPEPNA